MKSKSIAILSLLVLVALPCLSEGGSVAFTFYTLSRTQPKLGNPPAGFTPAPAVLNGRWQARGDSSSDDLYIFNSIYYRRIEGESWYNMAGFVDVKGDRITFYPQIYEKDTDSGYVWAAVSEKPAPHQWKLKNNNLYLKDLRFEGMDFESLVKVTVDQE